MTASMARAISTYLFHHALLGVHVLDQVQRAGFGLVEIYCAGSHFDYTNSSQVRDVAEWFADSPVVLHSLHAPLYRGTEGNSPHSILSIAFLEKQRRQDSMDEIKRALEVAERVPFRYLVAHLGIAGDEFDLRKFDAAFTSLEHLRLFARQRGVEILIENTLNDLATPRRLREFMDHTHMRDLKVCFDSGHAHLDGGVDEALELLHGRIASTHLHDNSGAKDEHLAPGDGKIAWDKLVATLRQSGEIPLLLEARGSDAKPVTLEQAASAAAKLESLWEGTRP
jgi:sugar phosphate isomerase/epimerase